MRVGQEGENVRADVARAARDEDRAGHLAGGGVCSFVIHCRV